MARDSLTVDSLNEGESYQLFFTERASETGPVLACGGFVDVFCGFKLHNRQLLTVWREQPPLDARSITRIEVR